MSFPELNGALVGFVAGAVLGAVCGLAGAIVLRMLRSLASRTASRVEATAALVGLAVLGGVTTSVVDWHQPAPVVVSGLAGAAYAWWSYRRIMSATPVGGSARLVDHDFRRPKRRTDRWILVTGSAASGKTALIEQIVADAVASRSFQTLRLAGPPRYARDAGVSAVELSISSIAGRLAASPQAVYAASKWAVEAVSEILAQEVNPLGIKVAVIEPGVIMTPIFGKGDPSYVPPAPYAHLWRRFMRMFEVALPNASPASDVGDAVLAAVESDAGFHRYVVGFAGPEFVAARESMTDEAWADYGREMSEAETNDFFRPILGEGLYPEAAGD